MSFIDLCKKHWSQLSVEERAALLTELNSAMKSSLAVLWNDTPIDALANCPDLNSLPSDLCGHLILALTDQGFSSHKFTQAMRTILKIYKERS